MEAFSYEGSSRTEWELAQSRELTKQPISKDLKSHEHYSETG